MKTIDRKKQPDIKSIEEFSLKSPQEQKLDNGIPTYCFDAGTQDVIRIDCIFEAGTWHQDTKLTAFSTIKMLTEGSKNYTAAQIAEVFDAHGAFLETESERDNACISLYTLNKHLKTLLPYFTELIREPIFPEHELDVFLSNKKQEHLVAMQRVNFLAKIKFIEQLFGKDHPYGKMAQIEDYDQVDRSDLINFHKKYYHSGNLKIILSGKIKTDSFHLINTYLGNKDWRKNKAIEEKTYPIQPLVDKKIFVPKQNALQSGIRIGKILFTKHHNDFFGMYILNTILGGYFGSRLMSNIREDKGYTYGIGSGLVSMKHAGYLYISSEVGADVRKEAVKEIFKELELLKKKPVSNEELDLVKNYLYGSFLRSIDGPFALADRFISMFHYGYDFKEYYQRYFDTIKKITSDDLLHLANTYFDIDTFSETVIGQ